MKAIKHLLDIADAAHWIYFLYTHIPSIGVFLAIPAVQFVLILVAIFGAGMLYKRWLFRHC